MATIKVSEFTRPDGTIDYAAMAKAYSASHVAADPSSFNGIAVAAIDATVAGLLGDATSMRFGASVLTDAVMATLGERIPHGNRSHVRDFVFATVASRYGKNGKAPKGRNGGITLTRPAPVKATPALATHKRGQ